MKIAVRLLVLALCGLCWYQSSVIVSLRENAQKPSALLGEPSAEDRIFHNQSYMWIEVTGEFAGLECPSDRNCL